MMQGVRQRGGWEARLGLGDKRSQTLLLAALALTLVLVLGLENYYASRPAAEVAEGGAYGTPKAANTEYPQMHMSPHDRVWNQDNFGKQKRAAAAAAAAVEAAEAAGAATDAIDASALADAADPPGGQPTDEDIIKKCQEDMDPRGCPFNILQNVQASDVMMKPYPHLVKEHALPQWIYERLEAVYPSDRTVLEVNMDGKKLPVKNNFRYDMSIKQMMRDAEKLDPLWVQFAKFHASRAFYTEVVRVFGEGIRLQRPEVEQTKGKRLEDMNLAHRFLEKSDTEMNIDCQIGINSPVKAMGTVRGLHHDMIAEIYAGLLYMRQDGDTSRGGQFQVWNCPAPCEKSMYKSKRDPKMKLVAEVPYAKNTLAFFINSRTSIHAVSPRSVTKYSRRLVNFIGQTYGGRGAAAASTSAGASADAARAASPAPQATESEDSGAVPNPCPPLKAGHKLLDSPTLGDEHLPYLDLSAIVQKFGFTYAPPPPACSPPAPVMKQRQV